MHSASGTAVSSMPPVVIASIGSEIPIVASGILLDARDGMRFTSIDSPDPGLQRVSDLYRDCQMQHPVGYFIENDGLQATVLYPTTVSSRLLGSMRMRLYDKAGVGTVGRIIPRLTRSLNGITLELRVMPESDDLLARFTTVEGRLNPEPGEILINEVISNCKTAPTGLFIHPTRSGEPSRVTVFYSSKVSAETLWSVVAQLTENLSSEIILLRQKYVREAHTNLVKPR